MKDALILDVAYAWRRLTRGRVFAAVAGASMAAATVAVGTMFAIVNTTDIRALAYDPQDRIVVIQSRHDTASATPRTTGPSSTMIVYAELRRRLSKVADLEAVGVVTRRDADPDRAGDIIDGHVATPGFKAVAGATVDRGRWFVDADTASGAPGTVVLSHAYWRSRFGGDTGIVGREVLLADRFPATAAPRSYRVIGVLAADFVWDQTNTFWLPAGPAEVQLRSAVSVVGTLRTHDDLAALNGELRAAARDLTTMLDDMRPPGDRELGGRLELYATSYRTLLHARSGGRNMRAALFGLALCALVLAAANVIFLNILDVQTRRAEFGLRMALGASRWRIMGQTLVEALVLTMPAAGLGLALCPLAIRLAGEKLDVAAFGVNPTLDGDTLVFVLLVAISVAAVLGAVMARVAMRSSARVAGRTGTSATTRLLAPHRAIVALETAIAIVVLTAAMTCVRELWRLSRNEIGYSPTNMVLLAAPLTRPRPADDVRAQGSATLATIRSLPGVEATALRATDLNVQLRIDGNATRVPPTVARQVLDVTPEYFSTLGIDLRAGRFFTQRDDAGQEDVVLISQAAAEKLFPSAQALGRRIAMAGMGPQASERWATVIGIVADARLHENPLTPRQVTIYRPFAQGQPFSLQVVAKVARQENLSYRQLRSLRPGSGNNAWKVTFLNEEVNRFLATPRFTAALLTALAALALGLAFVGVFGITALSVSVRTRDIVLRIALGADARRLAVGTFVSSMLPVVVGVCAGTAASYALRGAYETLLNGTTDQSSALTVEASVAALLIAFTASLLPTRRALHLDPAQALRWE